MQILAFVGIVWLLATVYVNHPQMPKQVVDFILDDFPYRIVLFGFAGFILVVLVSFINN